MMWVLVALPVLGAGALTSLLLARAPRAALLVSMSALFAAGLMLLGDSLPMLSGAQRAVRWNLEWSMPFGRAALAVDGLSAWFLMTMGMLAVCVAPYSFAYMRPYERKEPVHRFGALMCLMLASLIVFVTAYDAVVFLVGWELMTLSAFLLVMFHDTRPEVRRGAWMYLIATHLATALCLLPLFGIIYGESRSTLFSDIATTLHYARPDLLPVLFFLGLAGFGAKAGFFPMHIWLPAAHPVAPTPVSAFLSGVVVKVGIYGLLRLLAWMPPVPVYCGGALLAVGIVSGVMGVLYALAQHDLKRLLAYHTIENIGIIAIAIAVGMLGRTTHHAAIAALGFTGALLHVTNHALFKGLLFLSAGTVLHGTGTLAIERLGGLARRTPFNAFGFLVGAVAICGLPPLNGFIGEWVIYSGLLTAAQHRTGLSGGIPALGVFSLALMGSLALACFAKVFGVVFLGEARDPEITPHATPAAMKLAMAALAIACALIGLAPGLWLPLTFGATGVLTGLSAGLIDPAFKSVLDTGFRLSLMAALLGGISVALLLFRKALRVWRHPRKSAAPPARVPTWGCGYAYPAPRMQYTATSFALPLIRAFRMALWPEQTFVAPAGPFPGESRAGIHVPDFAEHDVFAPLFRGFARFSVMYRNFTWSGLPVTRREAPTHGRVGPVKTLLGNIATALRKGTVQVYLAFIAITLIVLFFVESFAVRHAAPAPVSGQTGQTDNTGTAP